MESFGFCVFIAFSGGNTAALFVSQIRVGEQFTQRNIQSFGEPNQHTQR